MTEHTVHIEGDLSADLLSELSSALLTGEVTNAIVIVDAGQKLLVGCAQAKTNPHAFVGLCIESALRILRDHSSSGEEYQRVLMSIMGTAHDRVWEDDGSTISNLVEADKNPTMH